MRDCWPLVITCQLIPYTFRSTAQKFQCPHILRLALTYPYSVYGFIADLIMDLGFQFEQDFKRFAFGITVLLPLTPTNYTVSSFQQISDYRRHKRGQNSFPDWRKYQSLDLADIHLLITNSMYLLHYFARWISFLLKFYNTYHTTLHFTMSYSLQTYTIYQHWKLNFRGSFLQQISADG